jgi:hypothetical protein
MSSSSPDPLDRPSVWRASAGLTSGPISEAYKDGQKELIKTAAGEPIKGITAQKATLTLSKTYNVTDPNSFPLRFVGRVNEDNWIGGARCWLCSGCSVNPKIEAVNATVVNYYEISVSFLFNPDKWRIRIPNEGMLYLDGGEQKAAYIKDKDGNHVAAQRPVPLNNDGSINSSGVLVELEYDLYETISFSTVFGAPFGIAIN